MTTEATPFPEAGYVLFAVPDVPYSQVRLPMVWDINEFNILVAQAMENAKLVREAYLETFPQPAPPVRPQEAPVARQEAPQRAPQPQQGGGQQQGQQTRADRFPLLDGWKCDVCGGPVGRRVKTGRMTDDAAVCLGNCKDGQFVHSLGYVGG